jgi:hypothetical protein
MSLNQFLSTVILVSFIVTIVLAVGSYLAYKLREHRRPPSERLDGADGPVFFERVYPTGPTHGAGSREQGA